MTTSWLWPSFIYIGMEQCLPTMPEEPDGLWAWALAWVDALRAEDYPAMLAESIQYIQDVQSRQFLPEGRLYLHTALDEELIF